MIINPNKIIEMKAVENLTDNSFEVQQNGIDLTIESIDLIEGGKLGKNERSIKEYIPVVDDKGWFDLAPLYAYSITFQQKVKVPENMCASIIQRSTLNRMGGYIFSGLYDSGFNNVIGAVLRTNSNLKIQKGARVAQIIFQEAESASQYKGIYQGA